MTVSVGIELCISNVFRTRNILKKNLLEKSKKKSNFFGTSGRPPADMVIFRKIEKTFFFGKILKIFEVRNRHFKENPFGIPKRITILNWIISGSQTKIEISRKSRPDPKPRQIATPSLRPDLIRLLELLQQFGIADVDNLEQAVAGPRDAPADHRTCSVPPPKKT